MNDELAQRPTQGGRLLAKWSATDEAGAVYGVGVADPQAHWESTARVGSDGSVTFEAWQGAGQPPAWLERGLHALLRSAWQRHRAGLSWPRRLSRWRPAPGSGESPEVE